MTTLSAIIKTSKNERDFNGEESDEGEGAGHDLDNECDSCRH